MTTDVQALRRKSQTLRHVETKDHDGIGEDEIAKLAKMYGEMRGDEDQLAKKFGVDATLIKDMPPADGEIFAKALYAGHYSADKTEAAKSKLREQLHVDLKGMRRRLSRTETKESQGVSEADMKKAEDVYTFNAGILERIAQQLDISITLLMMTEPRSARDFAEKLYGGLYTEDKELKARYEFRRRLSSDLSKGQDKLHHTSTKEAAGITPQDKDVMCKKFGEAGGDVDKLAELTGFDLQLLKATPPKDAQDFAEKAYRGAYTANLEERAKSELRQSLTNVVLDGQKKSLKSVPPPRKMTQIKDGDQQKFEQFYTQKGGDHAALAKATSISLSLLNQFPPDDAADFAQKLLDGFYSIDMTAAARDELRKCMRGELKVTTGGLKRTTTKEWDGGANSKDVEHYAKVYNDCGGDLAKLAEYGLDLDMMKAAVPVDGADFAKKLLLGRYTK